MRFQDGRKRYITDVPGSVIWRDDPGPVHELYNLEDKDFLSILVEIKIAGRQGLIKRPSRFVCLREVA